MNLTININNNLKALEDGLTLNPFYFSDIEIMDNPIEIYLREIEYSMLFLSALVKSVKDKKIELDKYIELKKQIIDTTENYINHLLNKKSVNMLDLLNGKEDTTTDEDIKTQELKYRVTKVLKDIYGSQFINKVAIDNDIQLFNQRIY